MGNLTNLSDVLTRGTGGSSGAPEIIWMWKDARVGNAAAVNMLSGQWTSLWQYSGSLGEGAVPTTVAVPDNTFAGSMQQTDPVGGLQKWLVAASGLLLSPTNVNISGTLVLYDRLLHIGGLDATVTTPQTVGGSLTRYTNGVGNRIWAEIYTQIGVTQTLLSASYSNTVPTSGRITQATTNIGGMFGGTNFREAGRIIPLPIMSGDTGVSAVANVTVLASTTTAGNFGITVVHPLAYIPIPAVSLCSDRNFMAGVSSLVEILPGACLAWALAPNVAAAAPCLFTQLAMVSA